MLNSTMLEALVVTDLPQDYHDFTRLILRTDTRIKALKDLRSGPPTVPHPRNPPAPAADAMDWEPAANKVQTPTNSQNEQKRAQWVSKDTLEKRKSNNLCLRCGGRGHFIDKCRLLPAKPPQPAQQDQAKTRVTKVKEDDDVTVVEELDSDTEQGKE
jgi:hypothetical protein